MREFSYLETVLETEKFF